MATNALAARSDAEVLVMPSNSRAGNAKLATLNTGQNKTRIRMVTMVGIFERTRSGSIMAEAPPLMLLSDDGGAAPVLSLVPPLLRRWVVAEVSVMVSRFLRLLAACCLLRRVL